MYKVIYYAFGAKGVAEFDDFRAARKSARKFCCSNPWNTSDCWAEIFQVKDGEEKFVCGYKGKSARKY